MPVKVRFLIVRWFPDNQYQRKKYYNKDNGEFMSHPEVATHWMEYSEAEVELRILLEDQAPEEMNGIYQIEKVFIKE